MARNCRSIPMAEPIDNRLIYRVVKDVQARLASLEDMRSEMREGFASLRAHMATQHADAAFLERRVVELERDVGRIKRRLDLADQPDN
jgi:septal ring factor EnvC (AmiA/AmiB activator)